MSGTQNGNGDRSINPAPEGAQEGATIEETAFTRQCSRILEQFQGGQLSLAESLVQIAVQVSTAGLGAQEAETVTRYYYKQLEQVNNSLNRNTPAGAVLSQTISGSNGPSDASVAPESALRGQRDELQQRSRKRKRRMSRREYESDRSSSNEDELDGPDDDLVPWNRPDFDRDYAAEDRKFLELYNLQLSSWNYRHKSWHAILQSLINKAGKPPFPDGEWERIVRGRVCDFKTVLGEFKSAITGYETSENFGEFKISYRGGATSGRDVLTATDWGTAFDAFADAILYVWPERLREFTRYKRHINGQFWILQPQEHGRIIAYDRAVRTRFAQSKNFLLHQHFEYSDLKDYWLGGARSITSADLRPLQLSIKGIPQRAIEICNNYNAGKCHKSGCKYRHVCLDCGKGGHVKGECGKSESKGKGKDQA